MSNFISSIFLLILMCISMHICEAGRESFGASPSSQHYSAKGSVVVVEKLDQIQKGHGGAIIEDEKHHHHHSKDHHHQSMKTSEEPKSGVVAILRMEGGDEILESSSSGQMDLVNATRLTTTTTTTTNKEIKPRGRVLSAKDEALVSNGTDTVVEDNLAFTDYDPPHHSPPIHNKKF